MKCARSCTGLDGESRAVGHTRERHGRRRHGEEFPLELRVSEVLRDDRRLFIAKNDGVYHKANGSPAAGVQASGILKSVMIYPNPALGGAVTVRSEGIDELEVWDMSGKLVHKALAPSVMYALRLDVAGTYVFRMISGRQAISRTVVVN